MTKQAPDPELCALGKELLRQIESNSLTDPDKTRLMLRQLTGKGASVPRRKNVGRSPSAQVAAMREFLLRYGDGVKGFRPRDIPMPPARNKAALLVAYLPGAGNKGSLQRTFEAWWEFFADRLPKGFSAERQDFNASSRYFRYSSQATPVPGVYWVELNNRAGRHDCVFVNDLWESEELLPLLAGLEIIMALAYCPSPREYGRKYLSGLQVRSRWESEWYKTLILETQPLSRTITLRPVGGVGASIGALDVLVVEPLRSTKSK